MIFRLTDSFGNALGRPVFEGHIRVINPFILDSGAQFVYTNKPAYRGAPRGDNAFYAIYFKNQQRFYVVCPD